MRWLALTLVAAGGLLGPASTVDETTIAVIVALESPVHDVSLGELKRLFSGRTTSLGHVSRVTLYQHRPSREQFFRQALNTTVGRATRAWIALVFSGDAAAPPIDFDSAGEVMQAVATRPTSIGFIPLSEVDQALVKVLLVDAYSADDPNYPLR